MDPRMMMQGGQGNFGGGLSQLFSGLFGNSGAPYQDYSKELQKYFGQAQQFQQPFYQAGSQAIPGMQNWLQSQQNPSQFVNNLMGQYQESPWAKNMQNQAMRTAQNMGSASGLTGSTPLMMQAQQNAGNIASQDQNQWLQNVLGINSQYGSGLGNMMNMGQSGANSLMDLLSKFGEQQAGSAYAQKQGQQQDRSNIWGGIMGMLQHGIFG